VSFVPTIFGKPPGDVRLSDIQALIQNKVEENHHLEYKSGKILREGEKLSQWVSAFLNAEGGLIVIGVTEDDPSKKNRLDARIYPQAIDYAPPGFTRERLEQIIRTNTRGDDVPDIAILPVRDDASNCVYLVDVPQGQAPPYQAADGKYYRRLNFTKCAMEHYEIADFFGKRRKPCLHLHVQFVEFGRADDRWRFTLRLLLSNDGRALARYIQFTGSFDNADIVGVPKGAVSRIDDLRDMPSIQWNRDEGVLHPRPDRRTRFADVQLAQQDPARPVTFKWDLVAEDFDLLEGSLHFDDQFFGGLRPEDRPQLAPLGRHPID
jgi:hypothetical protein